MSAGCARCGSCCDPVPFERARADELAKWTSAALAGVTDPGSDEGWRWWEQHGWSPDQREAAIARYATDGRWRKNAEFITAHWTPLDDDHCACDMFDRAHRLCMAQDTKPPVCRDFPWYGREPSAGFTRLPGQCSYLADLPPDQRPEGSRPLIPLMPV